MIDKWCSILNVPKVTSVEKVPWNSKFPPVVLLKIDHPFFFWSLFDELLMDHHGEFVHQRIKLLRAFQEGTLFGLQIEMTEELFERRIHFDPILTKVGPHALFPCLCIISRQHPTMLEFIWVAGRARGHGLARTLMSLLGINTVHPLETMGCLEFLSKCGIISVFPKGTNQDAV